MSSSPVLEKSHRCAGGQLQFFSHPSSACGSTMKFSVYLPPVASEGPVPVLYWLSGLTCTEENFMMKAGAQIAAAEAGLMLVAPDTSPRGLNLPGEEDSWDFGTGAGFYVNATQKPWADHYRMYAYVTEELPQIINAHFPAIKGQQSISGHSMGGHGALMIAARHPDRYRSVSAFAPICAPTQCPWGQKAFSNYLGEDRGEWDRYDACQLLATSDQALPMLVDQGLGDEFLDNQLKPQILEEVCRQKGHDLTMRYHEAYDHGFYFIASFIREHIDYHHKALAKA